MFGSDVYLTVISSTSEKMTGVDFNALIAPVLVAAVSFLGVYLTNKNNFRNLKEQLDRQVHKDKEQREYLFKKEAYQPIAATLIELQQLVGKTVAGGVTQDMLNTVVAVGGKSVHSAQLIAQPETFILLQNYFIKCSKSLLFEMAENNYILEAQRGIAAMQFGAAQNNARAIVNRRILARIPHISVVLADLIRASVPVLVALRNELGIETTIAAYSTVAEDNIQIGQQMLSELKTRIENDLQGLG